MKKISLVALPLITLLAACAAEQPAAEPTPDPGLPAIVASAEISAKIDQFMTHLNNGDIDALAAAYAEDARLLPPNAPMGQGHDFIRATFGLMIEAGLTGGADSVAAVEAGDLGYHIGTFWLNAPDGTEVDRGKFLEIWHKIDGEWMMVADMFSSDLPLPGAE